MDETVDSYISFFFGLRNGTKNNKHINFNKNVKSTVKSSKFYSKQSFGRWPITSTTSLLVNIANKNFISYQIPILKIIIIVSFYFVSCCRKSKV